MEQTFDIQVPTEKIYKERAIWAGTFLGGPLVAGYLIAENFKAFNEPKKAEKTWIYTIIATIVIVGGIFLLPNSDKIPQQIIPLAYTGIAYYLVQRYQGININTHIDAGGETYNWWRAFGIGVLGAVVTIASVFSIVLLTTL